MKVHISIVVPVVLAAAVVGFMLNGSATAQGGKATANNIIAVPISVNTGEEALCLVDTAQHIIAIYRIWPGNYKLEFKSSREYTWDLQIPENQTQPNLRTVKKAAKAWKEAREKEKRAGAR